jgi:hypothetical protein
MTAEERAREIGDTHVQSITEHGKKGCLRRKRREALFVLKEMKAASRPKLPRSQSGPSNRPTEVERAAEVIARYTCINRYADTKLVLADPSDKPMPFEAPSNGSRR